MGRIGWRCSLISLTLAGPWRHVEFRLGNRSAYERFDGYWDPDAARVARLELLLIPDETTRMNAVRSGQVDGTTISNLQIQQARRYGLKVQSGVGLEVLHIQLNRTRAGFDDVRVRQAMNHAIDRRAIIRALSFGYGQPSVQPFPEDYVAYAPGLGRLHYDYDPDRARALLAEAGISSPRSASGRYPGCWRAPRSANASTAPRKVTRRW